MKHLVTILRQPDVIEEGRELFQDVWEQEGAKASLSMIAAIVGLALGSIGVAGFGSAMYFTGRSNATGRFVSRQRVRFARMD